MDIAGKRVVVTGAGGGIGRAMIAAFKQRGASPIGVDVQADLLEETGNITGAPTIVADLSTQQGNEDLVDQVEAEHGPIDIFCANAGVSARGGVETDNDTWDFVMNINLMSHIWVSRKLVPLMAKRGGGYMVYTASAAGLLSQIGSITYSVTKHAAVAHAEFVAIEHRKDGVRVSVLCPQAVRTAMTAGSPNGGVAGVDGMIEPEQCVAKVMECIEQEEFLILPHDEVREYMRRKADDTTRWIGGMSRLRDQYVQDS